MSDPPTPIRNILSELGISEESAHTFRFGGVVGKIAIVALGGFLSAIGVAKYTAGTIQIVSIIAILLTTVMTIRWILDYAEKHPVSATLEGAEIILWRQQQMMIASKDAIPPKDSPVVPNPEGSPPQLAPPEGADR